jgi:uncharacterized protein YchJ
MIGAKRSLDAGGPFVLPAPPLVPAAPTCGHGILVETRFDAPSAARTDEITLLLRPAEQLEGTAVRADGEPVTVALSLATGRCTPREEYSTRFLREHPWLSDVLAERLPWLRERTRRAAAQRDRTPSREALEHAEPGTMVPYDELFPADWDLFVTHGGHTYWVVDHHCVNPACSCAEVVVELHRIEEPKAEYVGEVRVDRHKRLARPKASTPLAAEVFARLWATHGSEFVRRHDEVRGLVLHPRSAHPGPTGPRPARNAPCPCGSGKKYKRCCADRDAATMGSGR